MTDPINWFERGHTHFESCRRSPNGHVSVEYPTQDKYTPTDEAEFARGFESARREFIAAKHMEDAGDGQAWMDGY